MWRDQFTRLTFIPRSHGIVYLAALQLLACSMAGTDGSLAAETLPSENVSLECPGITDLGRQAYGEQRVQENITKYVDQQFKKGEGQTERDENRRRRLQQARDISNNYYTLVTDFYEYGYGKSFHFAPVMDGTTMLECIRIYERETATALKAEPGMKLLVSI